MFHRALLFTVALSSALLGQSSAPVPSPDAGEQMEVRVIEIDAVVTDRAGHPVTGLKRDDFEIRENYRVRPISNFTEVRVSSPNDVGAADTAGVTTTLPAADGETSVQLQAPPRQIILFFDGVYLPQRDAYPFFNGLIEFVAKAARPQDEVMIAEWSGRRMVTRVPFTRERGSINTELRRLYRESLFRRDTTEELINKSEEAMTLAEYRRSTSAENAPRSEPQQRRRSGSIDPESERDTSYRSINSQRLGTVRAKTVALDLLMKQVGPSDSKKIMLLISQQLPVNLEQATSNDEPRSGISGEFSTYGMIRMLMRSANARGFTLHTFHPADATAEAEAMSDWDPMLTAADAMVGAIPKVDRQSQSLRMIAHATGGTSGTGVAAITKQLQQISNTLDHYYSLGYHASGATRSRKITVHVKNHDDYVVRSRQSFVERDAKQQLRDNVYANFFGQVESAFPSQLYAGNVRALSSRRRLVPLQIRIPFKAVTLLPADGTHRGGFSVLVQTASSKGTLSRITTRTQSLQLTDRDVETARKTGFVYDFDVEIGAPMEWISIAVVDDVTKEAAYLRWDEVSGMHAENRAPQPEPTAKQTPAQ